MNDEQRDGRRFLWRLIIIKLVVIAVAAGLTFWLIARI